jgi:hypothetical protein
LASVLEVGFVPKGRYAYHEARYKKAGRPFKLKQAWGFKTPASKNFDMPDTVVRALIGIYSNPKLVEKPAPRAKKTPARAPRQRTRSDSMDRSIRAFMECTQDDPAKIIERPGLLARLTAEATLRYRTNPDFTLPVEVLEVVNQANDYLRTREFKRSLEREEGFFNASEISKEIDGVISLNKAREELRRKLRPRRRLVAPDGSTIDWF